MKTRKKENAIARARRGADRARDDARWNEGRRDRPLVSQFPEWLSSRGAFFARRKKRVSTSPRAHVRCFSPPISFLYAATFGQRGIVDSARYLRAIRKNATMNKSLKFKIHYLICAMLHKCVLWLINLWVIVKSWIFQRQSKNPHYVNSYLLCGANN